MIWHLKGILAALFCVLPFLQAVADDASAPAGQAAKVVVIPIREQISKPELFILRRGIKQAIENNVDTIVLDMKTPGGSVAVTLEMMEALDRFEGRTVTFVNDEAMSAGAIIAAVTDEIFFAPTAVIGAAEMIMGTGQDVPEGLKRKMSSYLGAKIRVFAGKKPHRSEVIRAMMDPDYELKIGETVIKKEGELLSLTAEEAIQTHGDPPTPLLGAGIAGNIDELIKRLHGDAAHEVTRLEITWSEKLAQYITAITPVLIGLGLLTLFIEFKTPGFGMFGIAGIVMLGTVFLGQYVAGLSGHEPVLFFLLGLILVVVELFFFPGIMVLALSGAALMFGSLVWAMIDMWPGEPLNFDGGVLVRPLMNLLIGVLIAVAGFFGILRFLPKSGPWGRMVLETSVAGDAGSIRALDIVEPDQPAAHSLIGRSGVAVTSLFPSGQVEIGGKRYEARLDMGYSEAGTPVKVTGVAEFALIVEVLS